MLAVSHQSDSAHQRLREARGARPSVCPMYALAAPEGLTQDLSTLIEPPKALESPEALNGLPPVALVGLETELDSLTEPR